MGNDPLTPYQSIEVALWYLFLNMGAPDPRKQRLIRLAIWVASCAALDLILLGLYFVLFDWFASSYLRMHEWKSLGASLNKAMAWNIVYWKGSSGVVFASSTLFASLTLYVDKITCFSWPSCISLSHCR